MKKTLIMVIATCALAACAQNPRQIQLIPAENFQTEIDGKPVSLYTIAAGDLTVQISNYGARVVSIWTPDKDGNYDDVELGYDSIDSYLSNPGERYLGAVVGPYANRIAKGHFELDGKGYDLPLNNNGQTLHGGIKGLDTVVWDVKDVTENTLVLSYLHPDGQDGFPGNILFTLTYAVTEDNGLKVGYVAETDAPTVCNPTFHPFFNLKGEGNGTILDHEVVIAANHITPVDDFLIPIGEVASVDGTPFDFREPHTIGERIQMDDEQIRRGPGYDHNWVLHRNTENEVEFAMSVYEPASGRYLEVFTDQPALQFYSGNFFDGAANGKMGKPLNRRESFAIETQKYPDSPNHPNFPSTVLRPGEVYTHNTIYKFSVK